MSQNDFPPPDDQSPPVTAHRGPPEDLRPTSKLGIWALLLSVSLGVAGMMTGLVWVLVLPAVAFAAYGVWRIRPDRAKGQGLAIAALILALLAGSCTYMFASVFRNLSSHYARGVLAALAGSEDRRLDDWLEEDARKEGLREVLRARYEAVVEEVGPYQREIVEAPALQGGRGVLSAPAADTVVEIGGNGDVPPRDHTENAVWARARFERAVILVELTLGKSQQDLEAAAKGLQAQQPYDVLSDVRFFREK